jgi:hypothetical protein
VNAEPYCKKHDLFSCVYCEPSNQPLWVRHGKPISTVLSELNAKLKALGIEPGYSDFSTLLPKGTPWPSACTTRLSLNVSRGSNEGWYVDIDTRPQHYNSDFTAAVKLIASAKASTPAEAWQIAQTVSSLLDIV